MAGRRRTARYPRARRFWTVGRCACGAPVLLGSFRGVVACFDPQALSQFGEVQALLGGHRTYWFLDADVAYRTVFDIRSIPAPKVLVVRRDHRCGASPPAGNALRSPVPKPDPHICPF